MRTSRHTRSTEWAGFWILLTATGCTRVDQQVDGVGCSLVCMYVLLCIIQFAIPALHRSQAFAEWRKRSLPFARGASAILTLCGLFFAFKNLSASPRFPTIAWGSAALTVAMAFWILQWSYAEQKEEQAKYAKLISLTLGFLGGLWALATKGPKIVPGLF